ncbi:hypothetical protein [Alicyclobacillus fodiniaquatilis]|uniref:Uncharacterized protein n=1 Tax=Alicyclobacillus fodiniaquatilis TaxID=1661150 RepID=A0ABW4JEB2_9BACL
MENPRKRSSRQQNEGHRGQVIDLRNYQNRRNKGKKGGPRREFFQIGKYTWLHFICYLLMAATVVLGLCGLIPLSWRTQALIWALLLGTIGLGCGLWLNAMRDARALRLLLLQCVCFFVAYLCALVRLFMS